MLTFVADPGNADLEAPANKRQHTQQAVPSSISPEAPSGGHVQAAASPSVTGATIQRQASVHRMQHADLDAVQASMPHPLQDGAPAETLSHPVQTDRESDAHPPAPAAALHFGQTAVPDNNTVMWEPLVVRVSSPCKSSHDRMSC